MELINHDMIIEFSVSHLSNSGLFAAGLSVVPERYPNLPRPRMKSFTDWDHCRKLFPFSLWDVIEPVGSDSDVRWDAEFPVELPEEFSAEKDSTILTARLKPWL